MPYGKYFEGPSQDNWQIFDPNQIREVQRANRLEQRQNRLLDLKEQQMGFDLATSLQKAEDDRIANEIARKERQQKLVKNTIESKKEQLLANYPFNGSPEEKQLYLHNQIPEIGKELEATGEFNPTELTKITNQLGSASWERLEASKDFQDYYPGEDKGKTDLEIGYRTYLSANGLENSPENYNAYQENQAKLAESKRKQEKERPNLTELSGQGWVPTQRVTEPYLDFLENMANEYKNTNSGEKLTPQKMYELEFESQKNRSTGRTAGSRLVVARKQNIAASQGLLSDMQKTISKLDYNTFKSVGVFQKFLNGQFNDPVYTEFMAQRADALFALANALKQNGVTDKSIEVEEEAFKPTLTGEAFNGWLNTQIRALNRSSQEMNDDYHYNLPIVPSFKPGQGGKGELDTGTIPTISTKSEFDKLKSGDRYIDSRDNKQYEKP